MLLYCVPPAAFFDTSTLSSISGYADTDCARGVSSADIALDLVLKSSGAPLSRILSLSLQVAMFLTVLH